MNRKLKVFIPISLNLGFKQKLDYSTRLITLNMEHGFMNRKIRLGIEQSIAKLCLEKMDKRDEEIKQEL